MKDTRSSYQQADAVARVLAQKDVDPNEVAKVFAHLRVLLRRAEQSEEAQGKAIEAWWRWLETVTGEGARTVVRSGRTREYFEAIRDAALAYLQGLKAGELELALGWATRLMRYYRAVPAATRAPSPFGSEAVAPRRSAPAPRAQPPRPAAPELPQVGAIFAQTVLDADDTAVLVAIPGFSAEEAVGLLRAERLTGQRYHPGNLARVEVIELRTLKNGKVIVELKPAPRRQPGG